MEIVNYPFFFLIMSIYLFVSGYIKEFHTLCDDAIMYYNKAVYPDYWEEDEKDLTETKDLTEDKVVKPPVKYEDKYLEEIRLLNKDWVFTQEEIDRLPNMIANQLNILNKEIRQKITDLETSIKTIVTEMEEDKGDVGCKEHYDEEGNDVIDMETLEDRNTIRKSEIAKLTEELEHLKYGIETEDGKEQIRANAEDHARSEIINERINRLDNCHIMEKTPVGNVIMLYDKDRGSFKFYSDATVPYRYLEVVGRKYVKMFNCRPLYIDMEEELRLFEEKWEETQAQKKREEEEKKRIEEENKKNNVQSNIPVQKKNVFAKFKSYNKSAGGNISMAPPKNNVSSKPVGENKENEKIILKERANRYTYEGKFANFNFLKKVEKKVFNKRLGCTFSDFKKMQKN